MVAIATAFGCFVLRAIQLTVGRWLGHEVRLPSRQYGHWVRLGFLTGVSGALVRWIVWGERSNTLIAVLTWAMACIWAYVVWRTLDPQFRSDLRYAAIGAGLALVVSLAYPNVWTHPASVDWLSVYIAAWIMAATFLIVFPKPPRPTTPRRRRRKRRANPKIPSDPNVTRMDPGTTSYEPGTITFEPKD